jgi:hypothetical protein
LAVCQLFRVNGGCPDPLRLKASRPGFCGVPHSWRSFAMSGIARHRDSKTLNAGAYLLALQNRQPEKVIGR